MSNRSEISTPALKADNLTALSFTPANPSGREVFGQASFELKTPGIYLLKGDNQSGKSTLIRVLTGAIPIAGGLTLTVYGRQFSIRDTSAARRAGLAAVFQDDQLIPSLPVLEQYQLFHSHSLLSSLFMGTFEQRTRRMVEEQARDLIRSFDERFLTILDKYPSQLSGGALAVAKLVHALLYEGVRILFLDEALTGVQDSVWPGLLERLRQWQDTKQAIIVIVTHNPREIQAWKPDGCLEIQGSLLIFN